MTERQPSTIRTSGPSPQLEARTEIVRMRGAGYGPTVIARSLNRRGVPTPSGRGRWWPETVKRYGDPGAAEAWRRYIADYRARQRRTGTA